MTDSVTLALVVAGCAIVCSLATVWHTWRGIQSVLTPALLLPACYLGAVYAGDIEWAFIENDPRPIIIPALAVLGWCLGSAAASPALAPKRLPFPWERLDGPAERRNVIVGGFVLVAAGLLAAFAYYVLIGVVPLWQGIISIFADVPSGAGMHDVRRRITPGHRLGDVPYIGQGYWRVFYFRLLPIGAALLWLIARHRKTHRRSCAVLLLGVVTINMLDGRIWMGIQVSLFFAIVILSSRIWGKAPHSLRAIRTASQWALGTAILVVSIVSGYRYLQHISGRSYDDWVGNLVRRLFVQPSGRLFTMFPDLEAYRLGSTWLHDFRGFLPGTHRSFAYEVHHLVHGTGWGYTLSPTLPGSFHANFGPLGVLGGMLLLGILVGFTYRSLAFIKGPLGIALTAHFSMTIALAVLSDITAIVMSYAILGIVAALIYIIRLFRVAPSPERVHAMWSPRDIQ